MNIIDPEYSISKYTLFVSLSLETNISTLERESNRILRTFRRLHKTLSRFESICLNIQDGLRMCQTNYQQNSTNTIDRFTPQMVQTPQSHLHRQCLIVLRTFCQETREETLAQRKDTLESAGKERAERRMDELLSTFSSLSLSLSP